MKSGPGKLVFANAGFSAPAGTVVGIAEGVMQLGENNATGNLSYTNASNVLVALNVVNNGTLRFQRSDSVNFTNLISGDGNLEVAMTPGGNLVLSGANTYAGSTKLESGTLTLGSASALGASALIDFAGASLVYGSGITTDISSSPITLSANATVNTNGNDVTWANSVGGSGALFKTGAGSLTLGGASTYAGGTTVSTGELIVANTSGSATGTGGITLSSGGSLRGTGIVSGTVTTVSGSTVAPGLNGVGTLTLGGLSLASGTILDLEFASTSSHDKVVTTLSGGLTLNGGGLRLFSPGSVTPYSGVGTYSLLGFAGSVQGVGPSSLSVLNPQAGYSYTFGSSGGFVTLQIIQDAILSQWTATGGGSWGSAGSWSNGVPSSDYTAQFTTSLAAPATVTLDGNRTVNGIVFDSPQGYTVASGTSGSLTLQKTGGAAANVLSGTHTISAPVVLASSLGVSTASGSSLTLSGVVSGTGGLVKDGAGLLSLTGHNTFSGSINAVSGVLGFSFADSLGSGALTLNGATLLFNADNAADVSAKSITFGLNGGAIDTNNNDVVFAGSIGNAGEGFFSKTGEGSLTLQADSTYLGQTFVKGGELIIAGNGSLGPVASAQALNLDGGVVAPLSTMTLDNAGANARPVVVGSAGGGFLVSSGLTLTVPGLISGTGQLSKSGEGDLSILGNNSAYTGGVLIEGGSVRLGTDRATLQTGIGTGTIKFGNSSALYLNGVGIPDNNNTFGTLSNAVVVPLGATAEIRTPSRGGYNGVASGQAVTVTNPDNSTSTVYQTGTLNLYIDGTRFDMSGVWPNFTGTLSIRKTPTGDGTDTDDYRLAAAHNMVAARVHVNSGVKVYQTFNPPSGTGTSTIHNFGELTADQGAILEGNPVGGRYNTYSVGALNTDFAISGQFRGSLGIFGYGYPSLTKVGTGTLTLNNAHMMASPVTVNGGTLKVTGAIERFYTGIGADGAYGRFPVDTGTCDDTISLTPPATDYQNTEPGALTVAAAGTLGGNGALGGAITVNGTLRPDSTGDLGGNLDLTGAASLTLAATATTQFDFKGANFTGVKSTATGAITFNGLLKFNFLGTVFDGSYKVFDLAVAPTGAFTGVSVTTTTATETALGNSGTVWSGTVGAQSYSFDASTGILTVTGGGTAVTPGASVLSGTAGNAKVDLSWTSASGADTYTVQRSTTQGGPYTNVISALAGTTYSDTTVTNGTTYYYVVQAKNSSSNLSGANSNEVSATPVAGPAHTALQTWRFDQFGVYDDDSSVLAGDTEDFDGDGLANLLEYALGTNPTVPNASPITVAKSGNFLTLTYPLRSPADTALTYTVQGSNDLTGGFTTGAGTTNTVGSTSTYTDNVSVSTAGARRFLRLSVSYTSP
jgi:autotransporter-associated beta strand protein